MNGKRAATPSCGTALLATVSPPAKRGEVSRGKTLRRGDIYVADLEPARGSEANKRRPVVIVSNDGSNEVVDRLGVGIVTIVPLTSNTTKLYNFQVLLPAAETGLDEDSKAQAEQVRALSVKRLGQRLGSVPAPLMVQLDGALRLHLAL